jgi:Bacterial Ig-like domain (group 3)
MSQATHRFTFLPRMAFLLLFVAAAMSSAFAQSPKITSISKVFAQQYQTITITGSGFGTLQSYRGDSNYIAFGDSRGWEAGYAPDGNLQGLIVNSWTDTQIVLGGFTLNQSQWLPRVGDKISIAVWNAQSGNGPSVKKGRVSTIITDTTLTSSPNPSSQGQDVTFTATVTSSAGAPPDGETVSFVSGQSTLGTGTLSGGVAIFDTMQLPVGTTVVKAVYAGDSEFKGGKSKPVKQVVQ